MSWKLTTIYEVDVISTFFFLCKEEKLPFRILKLAHLTHVTERKTGRAQGSVCLSPTLCCYRFGDIFSNKEPDQEVLLGLTGSEDGGVWGTGLVPSPTDAFTQHVFIKCLPSLCLRSGIQCWVRHWPRLQEVPKLRSTSRWTNIKKQKQTHRCREQTSGCQWGAGRCLRGTNYWV